MTTHAGGTEAGVGYYFDARSFQVANVTADRRRLPGGAEKRWRAIPAPLLLIAAPVVGGLYVLALPLVGFWWMARTIGRALARQLRGRGDALATPVRPGWRPGETHLTGDRADARRGEGAPPPDAVVDDLWKEIEAKRERKSPRAGVTHSPP